MDPEPFDCLYEALPSIHDEVCNSLIQNFIMMKIIADGDGSMAFDDNVDCRDIDTTTGRPHPGCEEKNDDLLFWAAVALAVFVGICCVCCFCYGTYKFMENWFSTNSRTSRGSRVRYGKLAQREDELVFDEESSGDDNSFVDEAQQDRRMARGKEGRNKQWMKVAAGQQKPVVAIIDGVEVEMM